MQLLKQTAGRLFRASAAVLTFGVLLAMVACDDDSQQPTSIDSATLDANTSDAAILDGASHDQNSVDVTDTMVTTAISGFAATGVALPLDSPVEANCVAGKQAAKTALGGAFTLPAAGLTFPCVLRAVYGTGEQQKTLYSVASAAGTAHITPLTHAVVTKAAAGDPATVFAKTTQALVGGLVAKLPSLQTQLRKLLAQQGLIAQVAAVPGDLFSGPLRPPSLTLPGDAHDQLLDAVVARFGQTEALVFAFSAFLVDLGLSARVDWSKCKETPRKAENGYYATGCNSRSVVFSSSPFSYGSPKFVDGTIQMRISTTVPELAGGDCLVKIMYSEVTPPSDMRPAWSGTGPLYTLSGWNASPRDAAGKFSAFASGSGTISGGANSATVIAAALDEGAQVVAVYTQGGLGGLQFSAQGPLSEVTMTANSSCLWGAN